MADQNHEPTIRTVASITREGRGPQTHAYNDPNLSAKEFLLAVMHDTTLPLSTRIKAARDVAPYFIAAPRPVAPITCRIIIPSLDEFIPGSGAEPRTLKELAKDPEQINANSQSKDETRSDNHHARSETPPPYKTETNSYPHTLIDYSKSLFPDEIQQIKAVVHALRPDY